MNSSFGFSIKPTKKGGSPPPPTKKKSPQTRKPSPQEKPKLLVRRMVQADGAGQAVGTVTGRLQEEVPEGLGQVENRLDVVSDGLRQVDGAVRALHAAELPAAELPGVLDDHGEVGDAELHLSHLLRTRYKNGRPRARKKSHHLPGF